MFFSLFRRFSKLFKIFLSSTVFARMKYRIQNLRASQIATTFCLNDELKLYPNKEKY